MNIRASYSANTSRVGGIGYGKVFKATKKRGNWLYGSYGKTKGWICLKKDGKTYLKKKSN